MRRRDEICEPGNPARDQIWRHHDGSAQIWTGGIGRGVEDRKSFAKTGKSVRATALPYPYVFFDQRLYGRFVPHSHRQLIVRGAGKRSGEWRTGVKRIFRRPHSSRRYLRQVEKLIYDFPFFSFFFFFLVLGFFFCGGRGLLIHFST